MIRSFFDMGFRPSLQMVGAPQMGISLKEMQEWWKKQYGTYKEARETFEGAQPSKPGQPPAAPTTAPPPSGGVPGWLLIGGAAALGIGVVIAVIASQGAK